MAFGSTVRSFINKRSSKPFIARPYRKNGKQPRKRKRLFNAFKSFGDFFAKRRANQSKSLHGRKMRL